MRFEDLTYEQVWDCAIKMERNRHLAMNAAEIFSIMMYAHGLGLDPFQALYGGIRSGCSNSGGKMELSPQTMNGLMVARGHKVEEVEFTDEKCVLRGTRGDNGVSMTACFSLEDAKKANLASKGNWTSYTRDMLFARAISRLCRRLAPDAIGTAYVTGEVIEEDDREDEQEKRPVPRKVEVEEKKEPEPEQPPRVEYTQEDLQAWANEAVAGHPKLAIMGEFLFCAQGKVKRDIKEWAIDWLNGKKAEYDDAIGRWEKQYRTNVEGK